MRKSFDPGAHIVSAEELLKLKEIEELEERVKLREGLPFLFGWKWYQWAREFYESDNKINLLCAANQISKSSTQIRKCLNWATDTKLWPSLWVKKPVQFWYLYPTTTQATTEFKTKWQQFLPQGEFKEHPIYGWKAEFKHGEIHSIRFNTGLYVFFKTYAQDSSALQTGTVDAMFCDEELPVDLYEELMFRLSSSNGYFHMVFTATLGQDFWRRCMEPISDEEEALRGAAKWTVSMYDCLTYEDGTESHWSKEKIQTVEARCSSHNEILKRVHGRFILDQGGRKYPQFDIKLHMQKPTAIPKDWNIYVGVDIGGGVGGHSAAITFVAVKPDYTYGRVFLGWRGDGISTTAGDILQKFQELRDMYKLRIVGQFYDWASKDFGTIASRIGEPFQPADKSHEKGEEVLNTLFKHNLLIIDETDELLKLGTELASLRRDQPKRKAKDDFADSLRYAVTRIPWDFNAITPEKPKLPEPELTYQQKEIAERRKAFEENTEEHTKLEQEFDECNELYGA